MLTPVDKQPWGPDVSHHNGDLDWVKMKSAGASFAMVKVSQGTFMRDPKRAANFSGALGAGLYVGLYHYLSYNSLPVDQVKYYLDTVRHWLGRDNVFQPVVDFENWSDAGEGGPARTPEYMTAWFADYCRILHDECGMWPIAYTYYYFYHTTLHNVKLPETSKNCPLWIADYSEPYTLTVGDWKYHTFHQYTSTGRIKGFGNKRFDLNRFNGSAERLAVLAGA